MKNFTKNWKTTGSGFLTALFVVLSLIWPTTFTPQVSGACISLALAAGLLFAKDGNVTGAGDSAQAK